MRDRSAILKKKFLHSDMLKLFLNQKHSITELIPDTTVFFDKKNPPYEVMSKMSRFVNQSNINKLEFDLAQIRLKYFRKYFANLRLLRFKLTDQSYLHIRLKSCYCFIPYIMYKIKP